MSLQAKAQTLVDIPGFRDTRIVTRMHHQRKHRAAYITGPEESNVLH